MPAHPLAVQQLADLRQWFGGGADADIEVAARLGVTSATIRNWAAHRHHPRPDNVLEIAQLWERTIVRDSALQMAVYTIQTCNAVQEARTLLEAHEQAARCRRLIEKHLRRAGL